MSEDFYGAISAFSDFSGVAEPRHYQRMPDDWFVGISDVTASTAALAEGRYKAVNMAGAATISAITNALNNQKFPFVFGGDGAQFAIPKRDRAAVSSAMAETAAWVRRELQLNLRVALIPVESIRAAGQDVLVARYAASAAVTYAMFSGGGMVWAEKQAKDGRYSVAIDLAIGEPDLTGLSCQWGPIASRKGVILTLIAQPNERSNSDEFGNFVRILLDCLTEEDSANPVPDEGPRVHWATESLALQATSIGGRRSRLMRHVRIFLFTTLAWGLFKTGLRIGGFDPNRYRRQIAGNTDYRKYGDGLMMTVDCSTACAERVEALLSDAAKRNIVQYGLHAQDTALMTCVVPSIQNDDHLHFVDGGSGGYAYAARNLKAMITQSPAGS